MKVVNMLRPENGLTEDPLYYMGFERFENVARDCYLFMADFYDELSSGRYDDKEKVALTLEEPNFCVAGSTNAYFDQHADKILTLCPYTAKLFEKRETVWFPFGEEFIPYLDQWPRDTDISYFGTFPRYVPWREFMEQSVFPREHRFGNYTDGNMRGCSYQQKLDALCRTKIALVHGLCNADPQRAAIYKGFPRANENEAFSHLGAGILPQIKSRMFEAAFTGALMLCYKDPWNPIEQFFTPGVNFLYFEDAKELAEITGDILAHYEDYDHIRHAARELAVTHYTTRHFVQRFLT